MNAKESDHFSMSAKTGYVGTGVSVGGVINKAYRYMPRTTYSGMRDIVRTGKISGKVGTGLGILGSAAKAYEIYETGNYTWGNAASLTISVISIGVPVVGLIDLGVEMTTGTSLSDRIGAGIDAAYP